jgi:hypothetical protein
MKYLSKMQYLINPPKYVEEFTCEFDIVFKPKECQVPDEKIERIALGLHNPIDFKHELEVFRFAIWMINRNSICEVWINFVREFKEKYDPISPNQITSAVEKLQIAKINKMLDVVKNDIKDDIDIKVYMHLLEVRKNLINKNGLSANITTW